MKRFTFPLLALLTMLVATACPEKDPNNNNHNQNPPAPTPPDSVTVSIATTRKVTAADLLGSELGAMAQVGSDGTYVVSLSSEEAVPFTLQALEKFEGRRPFALYCNYPVSYSFNLKAKAKTDQTGEIDLSTLLPSTINLGSRRKSQAVYGASLPDGLTYLEHITLTEQSRVKVTLTIPDCYYTEGTVTPTFSVDMRKLFESDEEVDGFLTLDAPLTKENNWTFTKEFHLSGVPLNPDNYDAKAHNVRLDAEIGLSGTVAMEGLKTTSTKLAAAPDMTKLNVTVVMLDVACETVTGKFDYKSKEVQSTFNTRALTASGAPTLDLSKSSIGFSLEGDMGVTTNTSVSLSARRKNRTYGSADMTLVLPGAVDGKATAAKSFTAADGEGFANILSQAPDELVIVAKSATDTEAIGTLTAGKSGNVSITPSLNIPVALGKDFSTEVTETVSVPSQLKEALKKGSVRVFGDVSNNLPLNAEIRLKLVDDNGFALSEEAKFSLSADTKSALDMTLRNTSGTGIDAATKAVITTKLTGVDNARLIKKDDNIQADLKVRLPK